MNQPSFPLPKLTPKWRNIAIFTAHGLTAKEIAQRLNLKDHRLVYIIRSKPKFKVYLAHVLSKMEQAGVDIHSRMILGQDKALDTLSDILNESSDDRTRARVATYWLDKAETRTAQRAAAEKEELSEPAFRQIFEVLGELQLPNGARVRIDISSSNSVGTTHRGDPSVGGDPSNGRKSVIDLTPEPTGVGAEERCQGPIEEDVPRQLVLPVQGGHRI